MLSLDLKPKPVILMCGGVVMTAEYLPKDVREGLELARKTKLKKKSRMRVQAGDQTFTILRYWDAGFALDAEDTPHLRGLVDLYNGGNHISQALIVASEEDAGEMVYEFKRSTPANDQAPLDYERSSEAPIALIPRH